MEMIFGAMALCFAIFVAVVARLEQLFAVRTARAVPNRNGGFDFSIGRTALSRDIPFLSYLMIWLSSFAVSILLVFVASSFSDDLIRNISKEVLLRYGSVLGVIFAIPVSLNYRRNQIRNRVSYGKEVITSSEEIRIAFEIFHSVGPVPTSKAPYMSFKWSQIVRWRVVKTHRYHPYTDHQRSSASHVYDYILETEAGTFIISRDSFTGIEQKFLDELKSKIGDRLCVEDDLMTVAKIL